MLRSRDATVTRIASRSFERARELADAVGCRPSRCYADAVTADDVDAVYIPLPLAHHAEWTERALAAGRHVLVEKPIDLDPSRLRALAADAASRGLVLAENMTFVHHPEFRTAVDLVADGAVGDLRNVSAAFTVPRRDPGDIRLDPALGGGALADTGVYPVRVAVEFLGSALSVAGVTAAWSSTGVDMYGSALIDAGHGCSAALMYGMDNAYRSGYEVAGSRGRLTASGAFSRRPDAPSALILETSTGTREYHQGPFDQFLGTIDAFAAAVRESRAAECPAATVDLMARIRADSMPDG